MTAPMEIAFFGSSLVSAYWNGAATYYRGIIRALHRRGHRVTFYEPDVFGRQQHRDIADPDWARVVVYSADGTEELERCLESARDADVIVKASGVGVFDEFLEREILTLKRPDNLIVFWDVDAPATLSRMRREPDDPLRSRVPRYDLVMTYGGGPPVVEGYRSFGARRCVPVYNALDPDTHHPVKPDPQFAATLAFLGNRLPDREQRVEEFFFRPARELPGERFLLGGNGWEENVARLPNVQSIGHVYTGQHNAFNCTPRAVLNISRESMARNGYSPATRVFEAAGAAACLITDAWEGLDLFLEPGREVLVAETGHEVAGHLRHLTDRRARSLGAEARRRIRAEHTYAHRAAEVESVLQGGDSRSSIDRARRNGEKRSRVWRLPVRRRTAVGEQHRGTQLWFSTQQPRAKPDPLEIAILGLSITSSWGNGHATTYRGLIRALAERGHRVTFLERDVPWYAEHRDLPRPPFCKTFLYQSVEELQDRFADVIRRSDLVVLGSFVPDGAAVGRWALKTARGMTAFYDIDTPVTLAKLGRGDHEYLAPALIPRFDLYLSFTGGPVLGRLERQYGAPLARPLYCSADPELYHTEPKEPAFDLGYLGTYSEDRQPALNELLIEAADLWPEGRFVVAGPQYPANIRWPANVTRHEHLPPAEHRAFYNDQRFTLNVTRRDMVRAGYAPSVRLFEAAACGTPIISDWWNGLDQFFVPGGEILIARSAGGVLRTLRSLTEEDRQAIARQAQRKVLAEHTPGRRAQQLEQYVQEAWNRRTGRFSRRTPWHRPRRPRTTT